MRAIQEDMHKGPEGTGCLPKEANAGLCNRQPDVHACVLHSRQGCSSGKALQQHSNSRPVDNSQLQRLCIIITEPQLLTLPTCHCCKKDVVQSSTAAAHAIADAVTQGCGRLR